MEQGTIRLKTGLAEMLKGGVIMDVTTPEQAKIAEEAGACAVMALERVPADIRAAGGIARMADPTIVKRIMEVVSIPVMAKARIGHFVEAQVLQSLGVDYIDESEVLTPADYAHHIDKWAFAVPFVSTSLFAPLSVTSPAFALSRMSLELSPLTLALSTPVLLTVTVELSPVIATWSAVLPPSSVTSTSSAETSRRPASPVTVTSSATTSVMPPLPLTRAPSSLA